MFPKFHLSCLIDVIKNYLQNRGYLFRIVRSQLSVGTCSVCNDKIAKDCDNLTINLFASLYRSPASPNPIIFTLSRSEIYGVSPFRVEQLSPLGFTNVPATSLLFKILHLGRCILITRVISRIRLTTY